MVCWLKYPHKSEQEKESGRENLTVKMVYWMDEMNGNECVYVLVKPNGKCGILYNIYAWGRLERVGFEPSK